MKGRFLLFIPVLFLLAACAQPRYVWQHDSGLGETELLQARKFCNLYAKEQTPPYSYRNYPYYPYYSGGYPYYYGGRRHLHRHSHYGYGYRSYYRHNYYPGINAYTYQADISRACLKGKGWNRINIVEG